MKPGAETYRKRL